MLRSNFDARRTFLQVDQKTHESAAPGYAVVPGPVEEKEGTLFSHLQSALPLPGRDSLCTQLLRVPGRRKACKTWMLGSGGFDGGKLKSKGKGSELCRACEL